MKRDVLTAQDFDQLEAWKEERSAAGTRDTRGPLTQTPSWPDPMAQDAYYGLAGEFVRMLEPHSEADPVALLMHLLIAFGNMVGRSPHFMVGGTSHHANLYCVNVGATASRKGTAKDDVFFVVRPADEDWSHSRIQSGLSSGEGFVWAVRDPSEEYQPIKDQGLVVGHHTVVTEAGVKDKRLLVIESEFGSTLRVLGRDGNTLSAQIRQAWDSGTLRFLTKSKPAQATNAHISMLGHITPQELLKYLNATEQANGFANRILWVCVRRSKLLPEGGQIHRLQLNSIRQRLREAAECARQIGEVVRDSEAAALWRAEYGRLVGDHRMGLFGSVTSRAEAQAMRLALVYALLDTSPVIRPSHLRAALAVWKYCEESARSIFGDAIGDSTADEILKALRAVGPEGLTRTELNNHFKRNKPAAEIERALGILTNSGSIRPEIEPGVDGRPAERWFLVQSVTK